MKIDYIKKEQTRDIMFMIKKIQSDKSCYTYFLCLPRLLQFGVQAAELPLPAK